jgi:hypothetical protein
VSCNGLGRQRGRPGAPTRGEPAGNDWQVISSNFPWKKLDAFTVGFDVPVAANSSATLEYRLRIKQ